MRIPLFIPLAAFLAIACAPERKAGRVAISREFMPFDYSQEEVPLTDSLVCKTCTYEQLSEKLNFQVTYTTRFSNDFDSSWATVVVMDKSCGRVKDSLSIPFYYTYHFLFPRCQDARSYTTGYRSDSVARDGYYGELVIADFNFDNREDFAIVDFPAVTNESNYAFYIQDKNGKFEKDTFLTDSMNYFPAGIFPERKNLQTRTRAGAWGLTTRLYHYHTATKTWSKISEEVIEF